MPLRLANRSSWRSTTLPPKIHISLSHTTVYFIVVGSHRLFQFEQCLWDKPLVRPLNYGNFGHQCWFFLVHKSAAFLAATNVTFHIRRCGKHHCFNIINFVLIAKKIILTYLFINILILSRAKLTSISLCEWFLFQENLRSSTDVNTMAYLLNRFTLFNQLVHITSITYLF